MTPCFSPPSINSKYLIYKYMKQRKAAYFTSMKVGMFPSYDLMNFG